MNSIPQVEVLNIDEHPLMRHINRLGITSSNVPDGLVLLAGGADGSPLASGAAVNTPLSVAIMGHLPNYENFDLKEPERTLTGIGLLGALLDNDLNGFAQCQPDEGRITPETFGKLRGFAIRVLPTDTDVQAMVTSMIINDLGKSHEFIEHARSSYGIESVDHDVVLKRVLEVAPDDIPGLSALPEDKKRLVIQAVQTDFNLGHFVQGEAPGPAFDGLDEVNEQVRNFQLLHAILDIGGAAGHVNSKGSLLLKEGLAADTISVVGAIATAPSGREAYATYLDTKAAELGYVFDPKAVVRPTKEFVRGLTRFALMSGRRTPEQARELLAQVSRNMFANVDLIPGDGEHRHEVISAQAIAKLGDIDQGAIPYYLPATLGNAGSALEQTRLLSWVTEAIDVSGANTDQGTAVVNLRRVAEAVATGPRSTQNDELVVTRTADGYTATLEAPSGDHDKTVAVRVA